MRITIEDLAQAIDISTYVLCIKLKNWQFNKYVEYRSAKGRETPIALDLNSNTINLIKKVVISNLPFKDKHFKKFESWLNSLDD